MNPGEIPGECRYCKPRTPPLSPSSKGGENDFTISQPTLRLVFSWRTMKNLQKNWIAIGAVVVFALIGGYFATINVQEQGEVATATTSGENEVQVEVTIDYAGEVDKDPETRSVSIEDGFTAWDVLKNAVGEENIEYKDHGGDMGIFVSGINKVKPEGNKFWLFKVNGEGADVGVSAYEVQNGDMLEFVISEF